MRLELAEAARRVRRELDSSVVEFGYFRRTAQQSAADSMKQMNDSFEQLLGKFFARLDEVAVSVTRPVETASQKSGAVIGAMSETIGTALTTSAGQLTADVERLAREVGAIATALEDTTARLNAMQTPDRVVEVQLAPIAELLTRAVAQVTALADAQGEAMKNVLAIAGAAAARSADAAAAPAGGPADADAGAATMLAAASELLAEIRANSRDYAAALAAMLQRTDETMRTFTEVLIQSGTEAMTRTDRLAEVLPVIEAKVEELAAAAEHMSAVAERVLDTRFEPKPEAAE